MRAEGLQHHLSRLFTLVDYGVIDEPPREQIRKILRDSASALGCSYAEISGGVDTLSVCPGGTDVYVPQTPLGARASGAERPLEIYDTLDDDVADDPAVVRLALRSVVFWPFSAGTSRCVLTLGWAAPHEDALSEDEVKFVDFLAALISRLLVAAERQRTLSERVEVDPLTGLLNRAAILEQIAQALSSAQRTGSKAAVLYIDLDRFKNINDTHGHAVGDATLSEIARRMRSVLRKHEVAGRIGGDEFAVVVSSFTNEVELEGVALRLIRALSAPIVHKGLYVHAAASVGIATAPGDANSVQDLLACADRAMYQAKNDGRHFTFYSAHAQNAKSTLTVDAGTFDSQFVLCVQPIVDARTHRPIGGEMLPRWLHPELGLVLPGRFLNASTDFDALRDFERHMLWTALRKSASLASDHGPLQLYLNIWRPHEDLLEISTAPSAMVAFEFGEERVAREPERYVEFIAACRKRGYRVGLSDFGGGDMPLRTLAQLDLDFVKIHTGQFREKSWNGRTNKALRTLVDQAHNMSCTVIAEAVETAPEIDMLVSAGVDALQGFKICSPLTERDFSNWVHYRSVAS